MYKLKILPIIVYSFFYVFWVSNLFAQVTNCDNITIGGSILGDESGLANPTFDPDLISNVELPNGGTGEIQYLWMATTGDPTAEVSTWIALPNSNVFEYDPEPISQTTHYMRCSRRDNCMEYTGETNIVTKIVENCDNVVNGGLVSGNQTGVAPFLPAIIENLNNPTGGSGAFMFQWYQSTVGPPFDVENGNWQLLEGLNNPVLIPEVLSETTYYIRLAKRENCDDFVGQSNIVTISILENGNCPFAIETMANEEIDCLGSDNGIVSVNIIGNTGPYDVVWNNGIEGETTISNLSSGVYSVTVSDSTNCQMMGNVTLVNPEELTIILSSENVSCGNENDGTTTVLAGGGTEPYDYAWSNGQGSMTIVDLSEGTYSVTVIDANGCDANGEIEVESPMEIPEFTVDISHATCVSPLGGASIVVPTPNPFTFVWNDEDATQGPNLSGVNPGLYTATITNTDGCTDELNVEIEMSGLLMLDISSSDPGCHGESDGSISVTPDGTAPFEFVWNGMPQTTGQLTNLTAGIYTVLVTDAMDCNNTATINLQDPASLSLSLTNIEIECHDDNGGVNTLIEGGTQPYTYVWNNGSTMPTLVGVPAGQYELTITDANQCQVTQSTVLSQPAALQTTIQVQNSGCSEPTGSATAHPTGGSAPYGYLWSNGQTTQSIVELLEGTYNLTVTDANGCFTTESVAVGIAASPSISLVNIQHETGPGASDGSLFVEGIQGQEPYTYQWSTGQNTNQISQLPPSNYTVVITDANQCSSQETYTILAGVNQEISIGDYVWYDNDGNGLQQTNEAGVANVTVHLVDASDDISVDTKTTDVTGKYLFENVQAGQYYVLFDETTFPNNRVVTQKDVFSNDYLDSDVYYETKKTDDFTVLTNQADDLKYDLGLRPACIDVTNPGNIGPDQQICLGEEADEIQNISPATGGIGEPEYLWISSQTPIYLGNGDSNWTPIPDSNTPNLFPGTLTHTTFFLRCVRNQGCNIFQVESNITSVIVDNPPFANIETAFGMVCQDQVVILEAAFSSNQSTYTWTLDTDANPQTAIGQFVENVTWSVAGDKIVHLQVEENGCISTTTKEFTVEPCNAPPFQGGGASFNLSQIEDNQILIHWTTNANDQNTMWIVESSDDAQTFKEIYNTQGLITNTGTEFIYVDSNPFLGMNHYRIRAISSGYGQSISEIQSIQVWSADESLHKIYPNPANNVLYIKLKNADRQTLPVKVYDPQGILVLDAQIPPYQDHFTIDIKGLKNGFYLVKVIQTNGRHMTYKIFKN